MVLAENLRSAGHYEVSQAPFCLAVLLLTGCGSKSTESNVKFLHRKTEPNLPASVALENLGLQRFISRKFQIRKFGDWFQATQWFRDRSLKKTASYFEKCKLFVFKDLNSNTPHIYVIKVYL